MTVLLPEIYRNLYSFAAELDIDPVAHSNVLRVEDNKWLFLKLNRNVPAPKVINQIENAAGWISPFISTVKFGWTAFETFKAISLNETSDDVLHFRWARLLAVVSVFLTLKITPERQETQSLILFVQKGLTHQRQHLNLIFLLLIKRGI